MSLAPTRKQVNAMAEVLGGQFDSVEEAAEAALEYAWATYEQRANYVVVGQLKYTDGQFVRPEDIKATKVAIGPYGTPGDAKAAGEALAVPANKSETFAWWLLPIHHGSPAVWHKARQADLAAAAAVKAHDGDAARVEAAKRFSADQWPQESLL